MLVGIDVKCMYTNFGGCDFSSFGDTATFKNDQISLSDQVKRNLLNFVQNFKDLTIYLSDPYNLINFMYII